MYKDLRPTDYIKIHNPDNKPFYFIYFDTETSDCLPKEALKELQEAEKIFEPTKRSKRRKEIRINAVILP